MFVLWYRAMRWLGIGRGGDAGVAGRRDCFLFLFWSLKDLMKLWLYVCEFPGGTSIAVCLRRSHNLDACAEGIVRGVLGLA